LDKKYNLNFEILIYIFMPPKSKEIASKKELKNIKADCKDI
jgi:hypothetical protein